ncbi:MAG: SDR family NAD(P)-dependent oxidoreductase [Candidatus Kapabacteria bacterium]|nr:SDR family NAD(P)-dependent oxidoreductase [Candidatus Kapabacteria bacterium]
MISFKKDNISLVSGAGSGLGRAISIRIIELGGSVIGVGRNEDKLNKTKNLCSIPENFYIEPRDLTTDFDNLPIWLKTLSEKYGKLSGLVNCAGIQETMPLAAIKIENSRKLFDINYFANIALIKGFSKKNNNIGTGSSIVCISSFTSLIGLPATTNYSASKGAINSMVKTLAVELARDGIRINSILPGHIITELMTSENNKLSEQQLDSLKKKYPLGFGEPEDVADLTCFLLSNSSKWITGSNIVIDGGASINF